MVRTDGGYNDRGFVFETRKPQIDPRTMIWIANRARDRVEPVHQMVPKFSTIP